MDRFQLFVYDPAMRRSCRLRFVLLASLMVAGGIFWCSAGSTVWCQHVDRIVQGMSKAEVAFTLGRQPDMWEPRLRIYPPIAVVGADFGNLEIWDSLDGHILVKYDDNWKVIGKTALNVGILNCQLRRLRQAIGY